MSTPKFSSTVQETANDAAFNANMLGNLLTGIYTMIYTGTLCIYASKQGSKNWLVIGTISLIFLASVVLNSLGWYLSKIAFVNNGNSSDSIFFTYYFNPQYFWTIYVGDICNFLTAVLADGLLIWRCFNVWDHSIRAISIPSFLLFCEIVVDLSVIIMVPIVNVNPSHSQARTLNNLVGTSAFVTFASTLVSTILIAYRIHACSTQGVSRRTRTRIHHVIEMLVQSAAAYSIATFGYAILAIFPQTITNWGTRNAAYGYFSAFYYFIAGAAPTIMVARVALAAHTNRDMTVTMHISDIQFGSAPPNATHSARESIHPASVDPQLNLLQEPEKPETKQEGTLHIA